MDRAHAAAEQEEVKTETGAQDAAQKEQAQKEREALQARDREVATQIKKLHGQWDRNKQEYKAVLRKSEVHKNTKGSQFEKDMQKAVEDGDKIDERLMSLLGQTLAGHILTDDEVKASVQESGTLSELMKKTTKKKTVLNQMLAIPAADED